MILKGVDPGTGKGMGRALFQGVTLIMCGIWHIDSEPAWTCDRAIIELPQIYRRMKGDPNDCVTVGAIAGRARQAIGWSKGEFVWPHKWKSNLDGDTMHIRIVKALTVPERKIYFAAADAVAETYRHNIADAIGICLDAVGRRP